MFFTGSKKFEKVWSRACTVCVFTHTIEDVNPDTSWFQ